MAEIDREGKSPRAEPAGDSVIHKGEFASFVEWDTAARRRTPYLLGIAIVVALMAFSQVPGALDVLAFVLVALFTSTD